jgi:hypothetical protein
MEDVTLPPSSTFVLTQTQNFSAHMIKEKISIAAGIAPNYCIRQNIIVHNRPVQY